MSNHWKMIIDAIFSGEYKLFNDYVESLTEWLGSSKENLKDWSREHGFLIPPDYSTKTEEKRFLALSIWIRQAWERFTILDWLDPPKNLETWMKRLYVAPLSLKTQMKWNRDGSAYIWHVNDYMYSNIITGHMIFLPDVPFSNFMDTLHTGFKGISTNKATSQWSGCINPSYKVGRFGLKVAQANEEKAKKRFQKIIDKINKAKNTGRRKGKLIQELVNFRNKEIDRICAAS